MKEVLNDNELVRYSRQLVLKEWGVNGQLKLKACAVLIVGCGGLGSAVIPILAAAGVGKIGLVDFDQVNLSNLPRQLIYDQSQIGKLKVTAAAQRIIAINSEVTVETYPIRFGALSALEVWKEYNIVVDATDNFQTRYEIDAWCFLNKKPMVYGSVDGWIGQVSVFHFPDHTEEGAFSYQGLYPERPTQEAIGNCEMNGVVNSAPAIIGAIQANEVLKLALQVSDILFGKVLVFDALELNFSFFTLNRCPFVIPVFEFPMHTISAEELNDLFSRDSDFVLLDVREEYEHQDLNVGGKLIPMNEIPKEYTSIPKDVHTVVLCKSGVRSAHVIEYLKREHGFSNLANLHGGILDFVKKFPEHARIKRADN